MATQSESIATWTEQERPAVRFFAHQDTIATEVEPEQDQAWNDCLNALLQLWERAARPGECEPNRTAIEAAAKWVVFLKKRFPSAPPTYIVPEPAGGVIVERRNTLKPPRDRVCELTFYNDGRAEWTNYANSRVTDLFEIDQIPE